MSDLLNVNVTSQLFESDSVSQSVCFFVYHLKYDTLLIASVLVISNHKIDESI